MKRAGLTVVALFAIAVMLDSGVVAADEAQFVERDGVLYVFNLPGARSWAGNASPQYGALIDEMAERYQVPAKLIAAVIKAESNFNPRAVSKKGARGLMQLMPSTAALLGVRDAFDPRDNVDGGVRHLRVLINQYAGDVRLALAAYNAGSEAVDRARGVPPYRETQGYVTRVLTLFGEQPSNGSTRIGEPPSRGVPRRTPALARRAALQRQAVTAVPASLQRAFRY